MNSGGGGGLTINETTPKLKLKESLSTLAQNSVKLKEYRQLVEEAQDDVVELARINYNLNAHIAELVELIKIRDNRIADIQRQLNSKQKLESSPIRKP